MINNLVDALVMAQEDVQQKMLSHFYAADQDYGRRVEEELRARKHS